MTVVRRRTPAVQSRRRGRGPAPLPKRFPRGLKVQVYPDFEDGRYAGCFGTVERVCEDRDDIYPHGRVAVRLVVDELYALRWHGDRPPNPVWFKPADLDRSPHDA